MKTEASKNGEEDTTLHNEAIKFRARIHVLQITQITIYQFKIKILKIQQKPKEKVILRLVAKKKVRK